MTKKKASALICSIISLMVCITMLLGTTFAWFTDETTSANNKIVVGNLDIELYRKNGIEYTDVSILENPFKNILWEPGHVELLHYEIKNEGSLALKYKLGVSVLSEVYGTNVYGNELRFSEHIRFAVLDGEFSGTREEAIEQATGNSILVNQWNKENIVLKSKESSKITLVVWMPKEVGNEANYRGDIVPQIMLGIGVYATQATVETDSFDENYDKDATYPDATLHISKDQTIYLSGNAAPLTISGTGTLNLNNVTMTATADKTSALTIASGSNIKVVVNGICSLTGAEDGYDLFIGKDATLEVSGTGILIRDDNRIGGEGTLKCKN